MKIVQYSRYLTLVLCLGQGFADGAGLGRTPNRSPGFRAFQASLVIMEPIWWYRIQTVVLLTAGTMLLVWLGEQITERGIGNGVSLIITIGILARLPQTASGGLRHVLSRGRKPVQKEHLPRSDSAGAAGGRGRGGHRGHPGATQDPGSVRTAIRRPEGCSGGEVRSCP